MIKKNKITAAMLLLGMAGSILTGSGSCIVKGSAEPEPLKVPHHGCLLYTSRTGGGEIKTGKKISQGALSDPFFSRGFSGR